MLTWLASAALAQTPWTVDDGLLLAPAASGFTSSGIGAPAVVWDPVDEYYLMFFETKTSNDTTGGCPGGQWSIGAARSDDGLTWEVWPTPVVEPAANTPYACVAAHPNVVYDPSDDSFHLWFKGEQQNNLPTTCASAGTWGCRQFTGVVHATLDPRLDDKTPEITAIDTQIAAIEALEDAAMSDYATQLAAFETALTTTYLSLFQCNATSPVCTGCGTTNFTGLTSGSSQTASFCQDYPFTIPMGIPNSNNGNVQYRVTMSWTYDSGSSDSCTYTYDRLNLLTSSCTGPGRGSTVSNARSVTIGVVRLSGSGSLNVSYTLTPTSGGTLPPGGVVLDALDELYAATLLGDQDETLTLLPGWQTELQDLSTFLQPLNTQAKIDLYAYTQAMLADAEALEADLLAWETQIDGLVADRADLVAYMNNRGVDRTLDAGVALAVPRVFGYPSVAKIGGTWVMMYQQYPNVMRAAGANPGSFVASATPAIARGQAGATWATTEVFDPSLVCDTSDYATWVAGRTFVGPTFSQAGFGDARSTNTLTWVLDTAAAFVWNDDNLFRHFDVVNNTDGSSRLYYARRVGGVNQIRSMSSTGAWDPTTTRDRVCP